MWHVLLLFSSISTAVVGAPVTVTGHRGEKVDIKCSYDSGYETNSKYFCKGECKPGSKVMVDSGSRAKDERFSLTDDTTNRVFTVTITDLRAEDGGLYWCAVRRRSPLTDVYSEIFLLVKLDKKTTETQTVSTFQASSSSSSSSLQHHLNTTAQVNQQSTDTTVTDAHVSAADNETTEASTVNTFQATSLSLSSTDHHLNTTTQVNQQSTNTTARDAHDSADGHALYISMGLLIMVIVFLLILMLLLRHRKSKKSQRVTQPGMSQHVSVEENSNTRADINEEEISNLQNMSEHTGTIYTTAERPDDSTICSTADKPENSTVYRTVDKPEEPMIYSTADEPQDSTVYSTADEPDEPVIYSTEDEPMIYSLADKPD